MISHDVHPDSKAGKKVSNRMSIVKTVVLGDSEVGKTSFTTRWTQGTFPNPESLKTTIGASFDTKKVELTDGRMVTISCWDFGGQKRFIEALKGMVKGAKLGVLFFDASHLPSLDSLYNYWIPLLEKEGGFDFSSGDGKRFILVANKIDLLSGQFDSICEEMENFCAKYGTEQAMISAKTGVGIEKLDMIFEGMLEEFS